MESNETKRRGAVILVGDPVVVPIASMAIDWVGVREMARWVKDRRPACLPDGWDPDDVDEDEQYDPFHILFPHGGIRNPPTKEEMEEFEKDRWHVDDDGKYDPVAHYDYLCDGYHEELLTDNELLVELGGRSCYNSFGLKAGRKSNAEYIAHTQEMDPPHASILYHAKMTFFIAGVSRRVSHELIRNYVGSDRDEEGSPSQESTRYVEHAGRYVAHPGVMESTHSLRRFEDAMRDNYTEYLEYIREQFELHDGGNPKGLARKRIYEAASSFLSHACETSWIWTTNPMALAKLIKERAAEAADLEFQRLAKRWARVVMERWPNLFPQPHMRSAAIAAGWEPS